MGACSCGRTVANRKSSPNIIDRFRGTQGKKRLVEALRSQRAIGGNTVLAGKCAKCAELVKRRKGTAFAIQDSDDNDIYFIISGTVSIQVNKREVARRGPGEHVGEMSLIDNTARRSATIIAAETCLAAKLTEAKFAKLALNHPELWRGVAVTLVQRLRERNKFHTLPRSRPVVFIGSSSEGLKIAQCIHKYLLRTKAIPLLWSDGAFEASKTTIEELVRHSQQSDFAVIVLTKDDITSSRGDYSPSPRDNAIFELGLFMGAINRERTFIVTPRKIDIKIPTDLLGVTRLQFSLWGRKTLSHRMKPVKDQLRRLIEKIGPK